MRLEKIVILHTNVFNDYKMYLIITVEALVSGHAPDAIKNVHNWSWPLMRMILVSGPLEV